jgi:hypothetical protein
MARTKQTARKAQSEAQSEDTRTVFINMFQQLNEANKKQVLWLLQQLSRAVTPTNTLDKISELIQKWTVNGEQEDYPSMVLGIYKFNVTGPATDFVKQTWAENGNKIKEEAILVVAPGFPAEQIREHLAYRYATHIGVTYIENKIENRENFNKNQPLHKDKFHAVIGNLDKIDRPVHTKLRYGVLNWTPVAAWKEVPGIAKELYFLHTWGVNMESLETVDAHYVFQNGQFMMDRYAELLDILFGIVKAAAEHLHTKTKGPVVVRITGLGLGKRGWFKVVPLDKEPLVLQAYKEKLANISNEWLQVRHPQYPHHITESFINDKWVTVEDNHDPFGDYPNRENTTIITKYPATATVMIVNAWDDGSFIGNMGSKDNTLDGWTVAGGSLSFSPMELDRLAEYYPTMQGAKLGANALNASFLHNVFFTPQLLNPGRWIRF